jgi:lipopolysaccharide export system ATP-binding protein
MKENQTKIFRMENLVKIYHRRKVVDNVSFYIKQKEIVGLLGPNGAGKTTSFYMAVGLIKPDSGKVFINDRDVTILPMFKKAREGIGYLAQEPSIFRKLTVRQNIEAVLEMHLKDKKIIKEKTDILIEELNLKKFQDQKGYSLSGGERRRCEIARALATDPDFILLDEPFAGVDPIAVKDIQNLIFHLRERGLGILITDHNVRETLKITDRAYIMYSGQILKSGSAKELVEDPKIKEIYLGEDFSL